MGSQRLNYHIGKTIRERLPGQNEIWQIAEAEVMGYRVGHVHGSEERVSRCALFAFLETNDTGAARTMRVGVGD